jgi:hypothetical protein
LIERISRFEEESDRRAECSMMENKFGMIMRYHLILIAAKFNGVAENLGGAIMEMVELDRKVILLVLYKVNQQLMELNGISRCLLDNRLERLMDEENIG